MPISGTGTFVDVSFDDEAMRVPMKVRHEEDGISISQIARELNTCGVPTKRGGTWWHKQVRRILDRFDLEGNVED